MLESSKSIEYSIFNGFSKTDCAAEKLHFLGRFSEFESGFDLVRILVKIWEKSGMNLDKLL